VGIGVIVFHTAFDSAAPSNTALKQTTAIIYKPSLAALSCKQQFVFFFLLAGYKVLYGCETLSLDIKRRTLTEAISERDAVENIRTEDMLNARRLEKTA
jgi:hypothetical protein